MLCVLLPCEPRQLQEERKNATWNLLGLLPFACELNLGKRDQSLENSLLFGGDLSAGIRNLVSDSQISPIYNAIRDKKVFEKGWEKKLPIIMFYKHVLGPFRECQFPWSSVQI